MTGNGSDGHNTRLRFMMISEQELVRLIAAGDREAYGEFYDRHAPRVLGLLVRWLPRRTDADDVLQEVFWQVWEHAHKYDAQRGTPQVWLFLMARSRSLDWLRRHKSTAQASVDEEPADPNQPGSELERSEATQRVLSALNELPEDQRQAVSMSFYDGFPHQEIAERLDIPLGTAKTRIRLGMRKLRVLLTSLSISEGAP